MYFKQKIILASQSPQRKKILKDLELNFEVVPSQFEEVVPKDANPFILAKEFALEKARDVAKNHPKEIILGVDTIVVTKDAEILIKPINSEDAHRILRILSGSKQTVVSGIALIKGKKEFVQEERTEVYFKHLSEEEIQDWIKSGLWEGRSGGFQIDGLGGFFVKKIVGDFYNVVGLPVYRLGRMLSLVGDKK